MVKGWIKLIAVFLGGALSAGFPALLAIKWGTPQGYVWWTVGFHLGIFAISTFLGALICSRFGPHRFWWFLTYLVGYFGIAISAMSLDRFVTSANDWPYAGSYVAAVILGYMVCGQLWKPELIKPGPTPTAPPMPPQPNL